MTGYGQHAGGTGYAQGPNYRWWVPAEGISRQVITAEIQRYLGSDALVKPGPGKGENESVNGYWISAYRNLTSAMLQDLQRETLRVAKEMDNGRYQDSPVYDARHALGPTPPLPSTQPAYPQSYPQSHPHEVPSYPSRQPQAPQYSGTTYPSRAPEGYAYPPQQPPYGGNPQTSVPPAAQYPGHYTTSPPATQAPQAQAYPYPSPPPSTQYTPAYPNQPTAQSATQYPGYTQPQQQQPGYYATSQAPSSSSVRPGYYLASDGRQYPMR